MNHLWKRSGALLLSSALLLPFSQAYAEMQQGKQLPAPISSTAKPGIPLVSQTDKVKLSKEAALAIAKRIKELPPGVILQNTSFRSADSWRTFPEWSFGWVKKGKENEPIEMSVNVSVNANTGELTSYSFYEPEQNTGNYGTRISREDAEKLAQHFLADNAPSKIAGTKLYTRDVAQPKTPLGTTALYNFRFVRLVNGILFPDNAIDITVNGNGKISSFNLNWSDRITFEQLKKPISADYAQSLFRSSMEAKLSYLVPWERQNGDNSVPFLAYQNPFLYYLDAAGGKPLSFDLKPRNLESKPIPVSIQLLPPTYSGGQLDQEGAVKLAGKLFNLAGYQLRGANYSENDYRGNRSVWNLEYEITTKNKQQYPSGNLFISLDAKTGDVYSYSKDKGPLMTKETAARKWKADDLKTKAIESMRRFTPTFANQMYLKESREQNGPDTTRLTYQFQRYVNGVAAATDSAYVVFDGNTGELISYNVNIGKEKYPTQLPAHKSSKEAVAAWEKEAEVELVYILTPLSDAEVFKMKQGVLEPKNREARLVYRMSITPYEQPYALDAVTGEWRSEGSGKPVLLHRPAPTDIAGHPADEALMLMYEYDAISLIDGKILPDREMSRGEMIQMLMIALNQGRFYPDWISSRKATFKDVSNSSPYFSAVEMAVDRGLLEKTSSLKPNEAITREELADMLVRALGYRKLAQYNDMFQSKLSDISNSKSRGAITIVTALGIIPVESNQFKPNSKVSRADAAVAFSRFLEKRSELQDRNVSFNK